MSITDAMKAGLYRAENLHANACPECLVTDGPQHQERHVQALSESINALINKYQKRNPCIDKRDVLDSLHVVVDRIRD